MKILVLRSNPRKSGTTEKLANSFVGGLKSAGADFKDINLCQMNIAPCMGCFFCSAHKKITCKIKDDMKEILEYLDTADALVCISPIYFYTMSSQMKTFFDRCFPFVDGYVFDDTRGKFKNRVKFSVKNKKFISISTSGGRLNTSFEGITATYKSISNAFGFEYVANLRRSESMFFEALEKTSPRYQSILKSFYNAGIEIVTEGKIKKRTILDAEEELAKSDKRYAQLAEKFWNALKIANAAKR